MIELVFLIENMGTICPTLVDIVMDAGYDGIDVLFNNVGCVY